MSELIVAPTNQNTFRRQLLATVSAVALLGSMFLIDKAQAADGDSDRPLVWIELGGQAEKLSDNQEPFTPPFRDTITQNGYPSPIGSEIGSGWMVGGEGRISFQPRASDWHFSASVRFGRANGQKDTRLQKTTHFTGVTQSSIPALGIVRQRPPFHLTRTGYADTKATNSESYTVADFQAGRDVGVGLIGDGTSELGLGVRFAQFQTKSKISIDANPDLHVGRTFVNQYYLGYYQLLSHPGLPTHVPWYHKNGASIWDALHASAQSARSFHGIGPSISWNASSPLMGSVPDGELALDWGVNGAILFGRQRAQVHHQTTARYHNDVTDQSNYTISSQHNADHSRTRTVIVPNVGGFAGWSFRYSNAKLSLGYRADFFFGAMDGGIDTARKENQGFYGPFATISVGLGG